jgi:cytoskeletal protein RodZ
MKEIGETLKEARENIGITIEEAANDLKLKTSQIESIESGDKDAFKDIMHLKYFIRDYSKYLGLDYEDIIDDFNEFLFDYTSRISLDDIKKARKQVENSKKKSEKKVVSPYTYEKTKNKKIKFIIIYFLTLIITFFAIYLIISKIQKNNIETSDDNVENIIK